MTCSNNWLLPILNVSSFSFRVNLTSNAVVKSSLCNNFNYFTREPYETVSSFERNAPFVFEKFQFIWGSEPSIGIGSAAKFWKKTSSESYVLNALEDECAFLARDFLLESTTRNNTYLEGNRMFLYPECSTCSNLNEEPILGIYSCGNKCNGYYIEKNGEIYAEHREEILDVFVNSFYTCGIFGVLGDLSESVNLLSPCYDSCDTYPNEQNESGWFSTNIAIYIEFVILMITIYIIYRRVNQIKVPNKIEESNLQLNTGTWIIFYILFGSFISIVTAIIAQGINFIGNLLLTTLPILIVLPIFILTSAEKISYYSSRLASQLTIFAYILFALFPLWIYVFLDHPFLLNGEIAKVFQQSSAAGVFFFACIPLGIESIINSRLISLNRISSDHLLYTTGVVYASFWTSLLFFILASFQSWNFFTAIFDSILSVNGYFMIFLNDGEIEKGAAFVGITIASIAWSVSLFTQPLLQLQFDSILHWLILLVLVVYSNIRRNISDNAKNINTFFSVSGASRIAYIITQDLVLFSGLLQTIIVAFVAFGTLYLVQFQ